ncbi:DUF4259 domain-containing protein [Massilia sp. BJB1822]|uniref:DUF4259 domain-containing protein n=1 Tax=Massilia sp. BJB1822 TaxID=2744470 RepID=UPI001593923E|nr:DUF4259 domain-containing protein [Massilia sp. BJB1822]NVE01230.1 DUF4259 domain-containing protein [Massilia sp. BJB1822]
MGTWAIGPYGNDCAQDWVEDLQESKDLYFIEETLSNVLASEGAQELEAPYGEEGIAAAETLARLEGKGAPADEDTSEVDEWVTAVRPKYKHRADLVEKAGRVLDLVLSESSELRQLWEEAEEYADWRASVEGIKARLAS